MTRRVYERSRTRAAAGAGRRPPYPGTVLFEGTNLSEGRGTERPFEWIGAPWIDAGAWADAPSSAGLPGIRFTVADGTPDSSKFAGELCHGVTIELVDRQQVRPMELEVTMLAAARAVADKRLQFNASPFDGLAGTDTVRAALETGTSVDEIGLRSG